MPKTSWITFFVFFGIIFIAQNVFAKEPKPGVGLPLFDYVDATKWGSITPAYKLCSTGKMQSPINIDSKTLISEITPPLKVVYEIKNSTLMTNGLAAQLAVKGKSELTVEGKSFKLLTLRWHTPSEHTIDGVKQIAEMHQVFVEKEGKLEELEIMIIATLYEIGAPDPLIAALQPEMAKLAKKMNTGNELQDFTEEVPNFSADFLQKIPTKKYIIYSGSLTTPPCTERVIWVITSTMTMTKEQVLQINELQGKKNKKNARPVQPLNGRELWINTRV